MTDIVEMLRAGEPCWEAGDRCKVMDAASGCCCAMAADEITALRAEVARLRGALEEIVAKEVYGFAITDFGGGNVFCEGTDRFALESDLVEARKIARAALAQKEKADD